MRFYLYLPILCFLLFLSASPIKREQQNHTPLQDSTFILINETDFPSFLNSYSKIFLNALSMETSLCSIPPGWEPSKELMSRYCIRKLNDSLTYFAGFIDIDKDADLKKFRKLGIEFHEEDYPSSMVCIPLNSLCEFLRLKGILRFEITRKAKNLLDVARPAVNAQVLFSSEELRSKYNGAGIVIGIVDYGFDYNHPDFYDADGQFSRIKRVWEQANSKGTPPVGFKYGTEFSSPQEISAAMTDTETETHGTHVAGIAAGSGSGTDFYGLASAAELVFVSTTRTDGAIADGLKYVLDYARKVNKPCVVNFSIGSQTGPHDGTSSFDRLCDRRAAKGILFAGAVGNNGLTDIYISKKFTGDAADTIVYTGVVMPDESIDVIADFWASPESVFGIGVNLVDTLTGKTVANSPLFYSGGVKGNVRSYNLHYGEAVYVIQIASDISPFNNKPNELVQISKITTLPNIIPVIAISSSKEGFVEGWCSYGVFSAVGLPYPYMNGNTSHTVNEIGGTGNSIISAGAFCTKNVWTAYDNEEYHYAPTAILGDIADFSSRGPTADGRIKPDISCPGYGVVSAFNRYFDGVYPPNYYKVKPVNFQGNTFYYGILQGTSEASPIVAGALALWLQQNPELDIGVVKKIIQSSATPGGTMPLPNNEWGWGILNTASGIQSETISP